MVIKQKHLIEFQIYYLLIVEMLIDLLHFPDIIRYILDVNCIFLMLLAIPKIRNMVNDKAANKLNIYIMAYMFSVIAFSLIRQTPVGQIAWAARNNYFYIFFFLICAYTLRKNDFNRIIKNVVRFQAFNIICTVYEFIVLGNYGDTVGGMFGTAIGCNGYLNMYLCVITAYVLVQYANKKTSLLYVLYIVLSSMIVATISELKFYFFELAMIVVLSVVLSSISAKNGVIVIVGILAIFVGIQVLSAVSPWSASLITDLDKLNNYATTTYGGTVISRAAPFSQINSYFFKGKAFYNLFGYGFGACEDSVSFSWANSAFATKFRSMQYRNLSTAALFLETGYVGLMTYVLIFVFIFINAQKVKQKYTDIRNVYAFTQLMVFISIANVWYNSSIRREIAYLTFFCLSAFIIFTREKEREEFEKANNELNTPKKKSYFKQKKTFNY